MPFQSIKDIFYSIEKDFFEIQMNKDIKSDSGSCALVVFIDKRRIIISNIGDSRVILSIKRGKNIFDLSIDHRPSNLIEFERIKKNGGKVYMYK